jgi:hypothetical protein
MINHEYGFEDDDVDVGTLEKANALMELMPKNLGLPCCKFRDFINLFTPRNFKIINMEEQIEMGLTGLIRLSLNRFR